MKVGPLNSYAQDILSPVTRKIFTKIIDSHRIFAVFIIIFVLVLAITVYSRGGKDLNVFLCGAEQTLQKKSPYINPGNFSESRPLFRYAPGFAILIYPFILKSKPLGFVNFKLKFGNIAPSLLTWYFFKIFLLLITVIIMFKIFPSVSKETSMRNLKISFLLSLPLIGYELANSQNKLIALFFMMVALLLFEKNRLFISAIFFNLALTVYIPLLAFLFYFILRKKEFMLSFIVGTLIVFFVLPSLVFGIRFNLYLHKEWFMHNIKPFFLTNSYETYIDLRISSQSLPSSIGRMFVSGHTFNFKYLISPLFIHIIIKVISAVIILVSCIAIWKRPKAISQGLSYIIFFILSMILPQYCIFYMWSWALVFYFAIFNYVSYPEVSHKNKKILLALMLVLFISSVSVVFKIFNYFSVLFWGTFFLWAGIVVVLIREAYGQVKAKPLPYEV